MRAGVERGEAFSGGAVNALDAKGRVSLPSTFRDVIARRLQAAGFVQSDEQRSIFVRQHKMLPCLQGFDIVHQARLVASMEEEVAELRGIERDDALEELHGDILGPARPINYDSAGRMNLPQSLRDDVALKDLAYFVTAGESFQIWSPEAYRETYRDKPIRVRAMDGLLAERGARA